MVSQPSRHSVRDAVSSVLKKRVVKSAEERRQDILAAAIRLFSEKGFNETTVDDVAEKAGVAKGTIYIYFRSKEHILIALKRQFQEGLETRVAEVVTDALDRVAAGEDLDYRDVIDDIFDAVIDYHSENRDTVEVVVRQTTGPDLVQEVLDLDQDYMTMVAGAFRVATDAGLIHVSDPEMMAYLVNAAIRDNIVTCLCYGKPGSMERLVASVRELLYKALSPVPGMSKAPRRPRPPRLRSAT